MIHDADNFGNSGIRAVATQDGLAIIFHKRALLAMKAGKYGSIDLVSGGKKLHLKLMRDSTFRQMEKDKKLQVAAVQEQQQGIEDLASELAK